LVGFHPVSETEGLHPDIQDNTNIEIKTVVSQEVSEAIFSGLVEYQANHALIAFRQNVEALTGFEII
jgi:hypothetical protein